MKGLVLAGGSGRRLRPLTHTGAKQLVPVANRPVIYYVIDNLVDAGVTDIGVVLSPETGAEVRAALGDGERFGVRFSYIVQDRPGGLAHAVRCARGYLGREPFVMYLGDNLVGDGIRAQAEAFLADSSIAVHALLKQVDDPSAFGIAEIDGAGNVVGLEEKPREPKSDLALVGVYFFRPCVFDAIETLRPSARGELEITDAISTLLERGETCRFSRLSSWWLDTGKKDDMLRANDTVLDDWLRSANHGQVDDASEIYGRVHIEAGARVERSRIRGPVVIGADAHLVDATIGPYTSIGDRVRITGSRVEHSILMEDARVEGIGRLEDSLIGRRVHVRPADRRVGGLCLMVGDDCVIELPT